MTFYELARRNARSSSGVWLLVLSISPQNTGDSFKDETRGLTKTLFAAVNTPSMRTRTEAKIT